MDLTQYMIVETGLGDDQVYVVRLNSSGGLYDQGKLLDVCRWGVIVAGPMFLHDAAAFLAKEAQST